MLVVIAILGVLSAVAIPNIVGLMGTGDEAAATAEMGTVALAVSVYAYEHDGAIPGSIDDLSQYFQQSPQFDWNIDEETGEVSPGENNPLYEAELGPATTTTEEV